MGTRMKFTLFIILIFGFAPNAFSNVPGDCSSTDQWRSVLGTQCQSSAGIVFVRVDNGWKDTSNGTTWFNQKGYGYPDDSQSFCAKNGGTLPDCEDLTNGVSHGFQEILRDMKATWLWCSVPYYHDFIFDSGDGTFNSYYHYFGFNCRRDQCAASVRCIQG
jgi:hypothetical protein